MQEGCGSRWRSEPKPSWDVVASGESRAGNLPSGSLAKSNLIYNLRDESGNSNEYYTETARFADAIVARIDDHAGSILDGYCHHLRVCNREAPRVRGDYVIEFLTLGMAIRRYETAARSTSRWVVTLARWLILARRHVPIFKAPADWLRAALSRRLFPSSIQNTREDEPFPRCAVKQPVAGLPLAGLARLIRWLRATGEYEPEAVRLGNWRRYLATIPPQQARHCLNAAVESFDDFASEAASALGSFTEGVNPFLSTEYARRGCREDRILCGRPPVEYHLNMLAADVMNRGLQDGFERTTRKVVLAPACMRGTKAATCKARMHGVDMSCAACDPNCAVNRITQRMCKLGAKVYLVPHSTGYSRWLDRWEREPGIGVIAVACLLNILPGGYEMRSRRIPSQCLPLDSSSTVWACRVAVSH